MHASESYADHGVAEKTKSEPGLTTITTDDGVKDGTVTDQVPEDEGEVFKSHTGQAEFRALGW